MKINALIDTIKRSIATGTSRPVKIIEHTLLLDIIEPHKSGRPNSSDSPDYRKIRDANGKIRFKTIFHNILAFLKWIMHSPFLNLIILVMALLTAILLLIAMISFFLSDVLIPENSYSVNDRGALVFSQPLKSEQYMFLLNTSELWADSGIEILEGDEITITVSGTFYSDIRELVDSCSKNSRLSFEYYAQNYKKGPGSKYTMMPDKPFGVLLYQIQPPGKECEIEGLDTPSKRWGSFENRMTQDVSFTAQASGILHFSVNDIPITSESLIDSLTLPTVDKRLRITPQTAKYWKSEMINNNERAVRKWFNDNCGEILVNVHVTRNLAHDSNTPFFDKIFIYIARFLDSIF